MERRRAGSLGAMQDATVKSGSTPMGPWQRLLAARHAFERRDAYVDGARVVGRRSVLPPWGGTPTVIVLGGTALSGRYVLPVAAELARRFPVWVPDLPGRGGSQAPKKSLSVREHADHMATWMSAVGVERAALVGNSMGCQIAVETAVRHRDRVSHLVLQGPTTDPRGRTLPRQLLRLLRDSPHEPLSLGPIEVVDWFRTGLRHVADQGRATLAHHIEDRLPLVFCPALVVRGSLDTVVPGRWARMARDLLPAGDLREIPGAAHAMIYTNPLELARVTEAFLRGRAATAMSRFANTAASVTPHENHSTQSPKAT